MTIEKADELKRIKKMGLVFLGMAAAGAAAAYFLPADETNYWLSASGKEGFYVLSSLFFFLGLYCLGSIWRRRNFI